jgi:hypothetical protein
MAMSKLKVPSQVMEYIFCQLSNCGNLQEKSIEFQFNVTVFSIEFISKMSLACKSTAVVIIFSQTQFVNVVVPLAVFTRILIIGFEYSDHSLITSSLMFCVIHENVFELRTFSLRNGSKAVNVNLYVQRVMS